MDELFLQKYDELKTRVIDLMQLLEDSRSELAKIKEENEQLKQVIEDKNEAIKSFQNQDKISKIVSSVAEEGNNKTEKTTELKLKINEYIKEIDKCILHLSK